MFYRTLFVLFPTTLSFVWMGGNGRRGDYKMAGIYSIPNIPLTNSWKILFLIVVIVLFSFLESWIE